MRRSARRTPCDSPPAPGMGRDRPVADRRQPALSCRLHERAGGRRLHRQRLRPDAGGLQQPPGENPAWPARGVAVSPAVHAGGTPCRAAPDLLYGAGADRPRVRAVAGRRLPSGPPGDHDPDVGHDLAIRCPLATRRARAMVGVPAGDGDRWSGLGAVPDSPRPGGGSGADRVLAAGCLHATDGVDLSPYGRGHRHAARLCPRPGSLAGRAVLGGDRLARAAQSHSGVAPAV